jgi:hypothetical protein
MTNIANQASTGVTVDSLTREWLDTWLKGSFRATSPSQPAVIVNGQTLDTRLHTIGGTTFTSAFSAVIRPWLRKAAGNPALVVDSQISSVNYWKTKWRNLVTGGTDVMRFAPFKLTAIVNRVDLRGNSHYGGSISAAGEGRFVYSIIKDPNSNCGNPVTSLESSGIAGFNVIFEYGIPINTCAALKAYQVKWRNLSDSVFGANFNTYLQTITDVFTAANAAPSKPNGSALNQLRSNEIATTSPWPVDLVPFWQLREFNINAVSHRLINATTKQEPWQRSIISTTVIPQPISVRWPTGLIPTRLPSGLPTTRCQTVWCLLEEVRKFLSLPGVRMLPLLLPLQRFISGTARVWRVIPLLSTMILPGLYFR